MSWCCSPTLLLIDYSSQARTCSLAGRTSDQIRSTVYRDLLRLNRFTPLLRRLCSVSARRTGACGGLDAYRLALQEAEVDYRTIVSGGSGKVRADAATLSMHEQLSNVQRRCTND